MPFNLLDFGKRALTNALPPAARDAISTAERNFGLNTQFFNRNVAGQPQAAYMWEIIFRDERGRGEDITMLAKTASIPASMSENIRKWYMGVEYTYSGRDTSPRVLRTTFWDTQDMRAYYFFQYWMDIMNEGLERRKVLPENYLRTIQIKLFDSSGQNDTHTLTLEDCYPTEISETTLTYGDSTEVTFDVIFSFRRRKFSP